MRKVAWGITLMFMKIGLTCSSGRLKAIEKCSKSKHAHFEKFASDLRGHHVAVPQVAHPEHERELAVAHRNNRVFAKHERLGALLRLRHLDEHASDKKGVDNGA